VEHGSSRRNRRVAEGEGRKPLPFPQPVDKFVAPSGPFKCLVYVGAWIFYLGPAPDLTLVTRVVYDDGIPTREAQ
jgi:hypothetical protein